MSADEATWGVQPNGFVTPTYTDLFENLSANLRAYVDPGIDLDADAPEGQMAGVYCRQSALAWEAAQALHDGNNPDNAEGDQQQDLAKLSGTPLEGPTPTTVAARVTLTTGTTLANGSALAYVAGHPDQLFTIAADFTAPSDGNHTVPFVAVDTGPIAVPAGTLTGIASPQTGWTAITNLAAGVPGSNGDTADTLRLRMGVGLARTGASTVAALASDIDALTDVISVTVLENRTDYVDGNGLAPHSFEAVVYASGSLDLGLLARTIWENKPAGIAPVGTTAISYTDAQGVLRTVRYTPVTTKRIWINLTLTTSGTDYPGDSVVASDVATALTARSKPGESFIILQAVRTALLEPGVTDVTVYEASATGSGYTTANISVTARQIPTFDPDDIVVTP